MLVRVSKREALDPELRRRDADCRAGPTGGAELQGESELAPSLVDQRREAAAAKRASADEARRQALLGLFGRVPEAEISTFFSGGWDCD